MRIQEQRAVLWGGLLASVVPSGVRGGSAEERAAYGIGSRVDTSPPAGCCGATFGCSGVNVSRANAMQGARRANTGVYMFTPVNMLKIKRLMGKCAVRGCCGSNRGLLRR
jgi:hypothetical protein